MDTGLVQERHKAIRVDSKGVFSQHCALGYGLR